MATVLKIQNLKKTFGDLTAVDSINLEIFSGELFGLLGPNGAGKSTLISMIAGNLKSDSGKIYFHGKEVAAEDKKTRERVGVCPQEPYLLETSYMQGAISFYRKLIWT